MLLATVAVPLQAQKTLYDKNCNKIDPDEAQLDGMNVCDMFAPCNIMMPALQKSCQGVAFVKKIANVFSWKKSVDSNDVMDAYEPEYVDTPQVKSAIEEAKRKPRATVKSPPGYDYSNAAQVSDDWYYSHDAATQKVTIFDGPRSVLNPATNKQSVTGDGVKFGPDGSMARGTFKDGVLDGAGQEILPDGTMRGGAFSGGKLNGEGFETGKRGERLSNMWGRFLNGAADGQMTRTFADRSSQRELWAGGKQEAVGQLAAAGQTPGNAIKKTPEMLQAEADAAFKARLAGVSGPGALYVLADEMFEAGNNAHARIALRELVSRHSDSPYAARAIDRLSATNGLGPVASAAQAQSSSPVGAGASMSNGAAGNSDLFRVSACPANLPAIQAAVAQKQERFAAQYPGPIADSFSIVEKMQYVLFSHEATMRIIKGYVDAGCGTRADGEQSLRGFQQMIDQTKQTCMQMANNSADCVARYDERWRR